MSQRRLATGDWQLARNSIRVPSVSGQPPVASRPRSLLRVLVVGALCLASASCGGSLFESDLPAVTRYVIATPPPATSVSPSSASQVDLAIGRPDVAPGLDTERIAVIRGHELDYYRGALWRGTVLDTVQAYLVTTLQEQKLFRSVASEQARVGGEYLLDVEVRDFQAEYAGGAATPTAHVSVVGRIIRIRDRKLIETISAAATKQAGENRLAAVASAFETAMQQVSLDIASRTATVIAADLDRS
jgi:cholesterol transport system auxiliary component